MMAGISSRKRGTPLEGVSAKEFRLSHVLLTDAKFER